MSHKLSESIQAYQNDVHATQIVLREDASSHTTFTRDHMAHLVDALAHPHLPVVSILLCGYIIPSDSLEIFSDFLQRATSLYSLDMSFCSLTTNDIHVVLQGLMIGEPSIGARGLRVSFGYNKLDARSGVIIANALSHRPGRVMNLSVRSNEIHTAGILPLLSNDLKLDTLDIAFTQLHAPYESFFSMIHENTTLYNIKLSGASFTKEELHMLNNCTLHNPKSRLRTPCQIIIMDSQMTRAVQYQNNTYGTNQATMPHRLTSSTRTSTVLPSHTQDMSFRDPVPFAQSASHRSSSAGTVTHISALPTTHALSSHTHRHIGSQKVVVSKGIHTSSTQMSIPREDTSAARSSVTRLSQSRSSKERSPNQIDIAAFQSVPSPLHMTSYCSISPNATSDYIVPPPKFPTHDSHALFHGLKKEVTHVRAENEKLRADMKQMKTMIASMMKGQFPFTPDSLMQSRQSEEITYHENANIKQKFERESSPYKTQEQEISNASEVKHVSALHSTSRATAQAQKSTDVHRAPAMAPHSQIPASAHLPYQRITATSLRPKPTSDLNGVSNYAANIHTSRHHATKSTAHVRHASPQIRIRPQSATSRTVRLRDDSTSVSTGAAQIIALPSRRPLSGHLSGSTTRRTPSRTRTPVSVSQRPTPISHHSSFLQPTSAHSSRVNAISNSTMHINRSLTPREPGHTRPPHSPILTGTDEDKLRTMEPKILSMVPRTTTTQQHMLDPNGMSMVPSSSGRPHLQPFAVLQKTHRG